MRVCAIVAADRVEAPPAGTIAALRRQTQLPDRVMTAARVRREEIDPGERESWIWLLDGGVSPAPDALERLLELAEGGAELPAPALLASKVVLPGGALDAPSLPTAHARDPDLAAAAVQHGVLAIRTARRGSLLVRRSSLAAAVLPPRRRSLDAFSDDLEWTARLLRDRPGLLVPSSVVERDAGAVSPGTAASPAELAGRARLLLGDAIERGEKPWFAFRFLEDALGGLRERAAIVTARHGSDGHRGV